MMNLEADARAKRSIAILTAHDVPAAEGLAGLAPAGAVRIRSGDEIARRAMCLSIVAELALCGVGAGARSRLGLWELGRHLSPREAAFVAMPSPSERDRILMTWRYEAVVPLMWAIELIAELPFPNDTFDPGPIVDFWRTVGKDYWRGATSRADADILDQADLTARLDRITRGQPIDEAWQGGVIPGVVKERHRAFAWMLGQPDTIWDEATAVE